MKSAELEYIEFLEHGTHPGKEATKATWTSSDSVRRVMEEQTQLVAWGIKLMPHQETGYPEPLLNISKEQIQHKIQTASGSHSILRGARSLSPISKGSADLRGDTKIWKAV